MLQQQFTIISTNFLEVWLVQIKYSLILGITFTLPVLIYHIYVFVRPGLYEEEDKKVLSTLKILIIGQIIPGFLLVHYIIRPIIIKFLLSEANYSFLGVVFLPKLNDSLFFILELQILLTGAVVLPPAIILLFWPSNSGSLKLISFFYSYRSIIYWSLLLFCGLCTPPDLFSLFLLFFPLLLILEFTLFIKILTSLGGDWTHKPFS